jgi:L-rhamnose isomerase
MAVSVGLDIPFDNIQDWKGIREKAKEVNRTKAYITNDETFH